MPASSPWRFGTCKDRGTKDEKAHIPVARQNLEIVFEILAHEELAGLILIGIGDGNRLVADRKREHDSSFPFARKGYPLTLDPARSWQKFCT